MARWWLVAMGILCAAAPARAGVAVGQAVVAEWQDGAYYTGTVKSAGAKKVVVAWTDGSDPSAVAPDEAFAIPKNARRALKAGALALCAYGSGSKWYDCRVAKVTAHGASVAYLDGSDGDVGWDGVIVPTGRAAKELAARAAHPPSDGGGGGDGSGSGSGSGSSDDGFNPTLKNDDEHSYPYRLECGSATTRSDIEASTTITLDKGCTLHMLGADTALHGNMECEIKDRQLTCSG